MNLRLGLLLILTILGLTLSGQSSEIQEDTLTQQKSIRKTFSPNPQRAALLGLIPGGGQIYNRRYWKLPIVYGALGGLYYYAYFNQTEYRRFKTAYQKELLGEPHEFSSANLPAAVLKNIRNDYRKTMEEGYIFMSLAYLLSIAEAYVDAHLRNFDINEDLSGHLGPAWLVSQNRITPGIGFSMHLRPRQVSVIPVALS